MLEPPNWTRHQLEQDANLSTELFRRERLDEPREAYARAFDDYRATVELLLKTTVDLSQLEDNALAVLSDRELREAFRYLTGPPISTDDLKTVAEAALTRTRLTRDPDMVERVVEVIRSQLDRRRFTWVSEGREPTHAERSAALVASAALMATQRLGTSRRNLVKTKQQQGVRAVVLNAGLEEVSRRKVATLNDAPAPGAFCAESTIGSRKADFVVGLYDHRIAAIECKVSNSGTNSIKRLNNDAAAKAEAWRKDFGERQIVPIAILSGVFKLRNLEDAQRRGLALIWAHNTESLANWIASTRTGA